MTILCHRCSEELTAPKFHNGHPYGYSCYEIVAGKASKEKRKFVKVDLIEPLPSCNNFSLKVKYEGRTFNLGGTFRDIEGKPHNSLAKFENDEVFMVTHDRKGKPIWKSIP